MLQEPVLRVTIYRPDGTLVYSSNPGYGASGLPAPMREALRTGKTYTRTGEPLEPGTTCRPASTARRLPAGHDGRRASSC